MFLCRTFLVNHPTTFGKFLKLVSFRHQQNAFPKLKSLIPNPTFLEGGFFNKLIKAEEVAARVGVGVVGGVSGWLSSASLTSSQIFVRIFKMAESLISDYL